MKPRFVLCALFIIAIINSAFSQNLTVAFTKFSIEKGAEVYESGRQIGFVADFKPSKDFDTLFVSLKIFKNIRIPIDSKFYLDENLLGPSHITVEFSKDPVALTSNDIVIGIFRPIKFKTSSHYDSTKLKFTKDL